MNLKKEYFPAAAILELRCAGFIDYGADIIV
jgi:hypothetical protein